MTMINSSFVKFELRITYVGIQVALVSTGASGNLTPTGRDQKRELD